MTKTENPAGAPGHEKDTHINYNASQNYSIQKPPMPEQAGEVESNSILATALQYAGHGWPVLPLQVRDKKPLTQRGFIDVTTNTTTINKWWRCWPDANIGIATGSASGLLVLDIDPRNGGIEALAELEQRHGKLPTDYVVRTSNSGKHYYFKLPEGLHIASGVLAPGIDIKCNGGYVVAPPSIHPSGEAYQFESAGEVPPAPDWLIEEIERKSLAQAHAPQQKNINIDDLRVSDEIKQLIRAGKPKGRRSEAIFAVIRAMVKGGYKDEEIESVLLNPINGLSEKPREQGLAWLQGEIRRARSKPSAISSPGTDSSKVVCLADVVPEQVQWLWYPYIPLGKVTCIEGDPGLGKSWLLMAIAAAISQGGVLPGSPAAEPKPCLLISAEDGLADTVRPRLDALGADVARIFAFNETPVADTGGLAILEEKIAQYRPKLVTIDPLVAYMGGRIDMNKANQTREVLAGLAHLAEKYRCAIVVLRHITKGGSDRAIYRGLGSIDITAACRSVLLVGAHPDDSDQRVIAHIKSNLAPTGPSLVYKISNDEFRWLGSIAMGADELLAPQEFTQDKGARATAKDFLRQILKGGERPAAEIYSDAEEQRIAKRTLDRAKKELEIAVRQTGEGWFWRLPK